MTGDRTSCVSIKQWWGLNPDILTIQTLHSTQKWCVVFSLSQSIKGRSNRVEAVLNHLATVRPDEDFLEFCDVLCTTNQAHIVEQYLTKDSQQSVSSASQSKHGSSSDAESRTLAVQKPVNPFLKQVMENSRHLFEDDAWKMVLINKRSSIIDQIDTSSGLIDRLLRSGVMNQSTAELCQVRTLLVCFCLEFNVRKLIRTSRAGLRLCGAKYFVGSITHTVQYTVHHPAIFAKRGPLKPRGSRPWSGCPVP